MASFWRRYSLSIVLVGLFLLCWSVQTWAGWRQFAGEHPGGGGYVWAWLEATAENWQSEFLQLASFVMLSAWLRHVGSPQSKSENEAQRRQMDRIERLLRRLEDR